MHLARVNSHSYALSWPQHVLFHLSFTDYHPVLLVVQVVVVVVVVACASTYLITLLARQAFD